MFDKPRGRLCTGRYPAFLLGRFASGRIFVYKNAKDVLPEALLRQIWKYVEGENIYIPKRQECRAAWGSLNGSRREYEMRNEQIRQRYAEEATLEELAKEFCLSVESIRKIV